MCGTDTTCIINNRSFSNIDNNTRQCEDLILKRHCQASEKILVSQPVVRFVPEGRWYSHK